MTYEEVLKILEESTFEDWLQNSERNGTYKKNLALRFEDSTERVHGERGLGFSTEEWAQVVPESFEHPIRVSYDVLYNSSYIETMYMVSVDGGRGKIPYPKTHEILTITPAQYGFARIVEPRPGDSVYGLDRWLEKAGISVERS